MLQMFQRDGREMLRSPWPVQMESVWEELRKIASVGFGVPGGRTWVRISSQAHSGTKRQNGKPGFRLWEEQIQPQAH